MTYVYVSLSIDLLWFSALSFPKTQNIFKENLRGKSFTRTALRKNLNSISFNCDTSVFWTIIGTFMLMWFRAKNYNSQCFVAFHHCVVVGAVFVSCHGKKSPSLIRKSQFSLQSLWWTSPLSAEISDLGNGRLDPFGRKWTRGVFGCFGIKTLPVSHVWPGHDLWYV